MKPIASLAAAVALLLGTGSAQAFDITFGTPVDLSSCSQSGSSSDRSCSSAASVENGVLDETASLMVQGQASADHGFIDDDTAIADITVTYDIPYTITRTVSVTAPFTLSIPILSLTFDATYAGTSSIDNIAGGYASASAGTASLLDPTLGPSGFVFLPEAYSGSFASSFQPIQTDNEPFDRTSPDPSATLGASYAGSAGEVNAFAEVPTDFRDWTDSAPSYANGGNFPAGDYVTQTYSDVIRVSFRLRAESRPEGSISTSGGEALACAGQTSPLGSFGLSGSDCDDGFSLTAILAQTGTFDFTVPEPSLFALLGAMSVGLVWLGIRTRS